MHMARILLSKAICVHMTDLRYVKVVDYMNVIVLCCGVL